MIIIMDKILIVIYNPEFLKYNLGKCYNNYLYYIIFITQALIICMRLKYN